MQNKTLFTFFPAVLSGLLLSLGFPDFKFYYIVFLALLPLLLSISRLTVKSAFFAGLITGLVHFLTLIYWITPTMQEYGLLHPALASLILFGLCVYLALYPALFACILKKIDPKPVWLPLLAATLWTGLEYIRTHAFTGFSWGLLGYSQYENLVFIQIADLFGVYGISFLIILFNSLIALLWKHRNSLRKCLVPSIYSILLILLSCLYGIHSLKTVSKTISMAPKAAIGIVQGNIRQDKKWDKNFKAKTIIKYNKLSKSLKTQNPDLIIWPETALPFYYQFQSPLTASVNRGIQDVATHFLIGSLAFTRDETRAHFYNRAYMFNPSAQITGSYDKHHLVPFGEYVPFGQYLTFLGKITEQSGDFSSGKAPYTPLEFKNYKTGILICFEILFPSITSEFTKNGATFLTTITNDAWFGHTSAAMQHFSISVFRAVESRRTLARAANTGISGFIAPTGEILETTQIFTDNALVLQVPALDTLTFYTRHGDLFAKAACIAIILSFVIKRFRKKDQGEIK